MSDVEQMMRHLVTTGIARSLTPTGVVELWQNMIKILQYDDDAAD